MSAFDDQALLAALHTYVRACGGVPENAAPYDERELESAIGDYAGIDLEAEVEQATAPIEDRIDTLRGEVNDAKADAERLKSIIDAARAALEA